MKELGSLEVYRLEECLKALAEHHNHTSANFKGHFPKKPYEETLASFEKDVDSGKSRIAVIDSEDRILDFCKADITGREGTIDYLIVLSESRGKGYGEALLDWALNIFRNRKVTRIEVKVVDGNDAIRFYEKHSFQIVSHILRMEQSD